MNLSIYFFKKIILKVDGYIGKGILFRIGVFVGGGGFENLFCCRLISIMFGGFENLFCCRLISII